MKYGAVAVALAASSLGVVLLLVSLGYSDLLRLVSIPLVALGGWTLAFGLAAREKYYGVWGGLLTGIGLALLLEAVTGNLLLNFSVLLIILPLALLAAGKPGSRQQ
ncbi:MAG: hypothetical protein QW230_03565 [Thermofilum sp.]